MQTTCFREFGAKRDRAIQYAHIFLLLQERDAENRNSHPYRGIILPSESRSDINAIQVLTVKSLPFCSEVCSKLYKMDSNMNMDTKNDHVLSVGELLAQVASSSVIEIHLYP